MRNHDLLRYIHLTPHASNELSHAGPDGRRPSIAGVRMYGRQPRTERPSARATLADRARQRVVLDARAGDGRPGVADLPCLSWARILRAAGWW